MSALLLLALLAANDATPVFARPGAPALELVKTIPVGYWAKSVELSPDGRFAVVGSIKARNATVIDTATLEVARTLEPPWFAPVEVAFLPSQNQVLISGGFMLHEVKIFDMGSWEQVGRLRGGRRGDDEEKHTVFPKIIAVSPDESKIYVSYWRSENVGVFDAKSHRRIGLIPTGFKPRGIAITPDGKKGYVCNFGTQRKSITVFCADRKPFRVKKTIRRLPNARHIIMSADGRFAYVSLFGGDGGVARIDTEHDTVVARSEGTGGTSKTLELSPDEKWIFLVNYDPGTVSIVETESLEEIARYRAGVYPQGVSVSADGKTLWTTEEEQVRVWRIEPAVVSAKVMDSLED